MLRDLITEKEYEMMDMYRQLYSVSDDGELVVDKSKMCPIRDLLSPWESAKSMALNRIFKDKLILDKHVHYEKSQTDIENDLDTYIFCPGSTNTRIKHSGYPFYEKFRYFIIDRSYDKSNRLSLVETRAIADGLYALIDTDSLAANKYHGDSFDLPMPDGKSLHVATGCKASKIIGKIAAAYNISGYEDFRIAHSLILNQKMLEGDLHISIHPMDYMTMSDNSLGWESCMSWTNQGGYRQGTVEMMNSPTVVIAYLDASTPYEIKGCGTWNNKKWRKLFIVDKNIIAGVKDYPYENVALTNIVLDWLKSLVENSDLGWIYYNDKYTYDTNKCYVEGYPFKGVRNDDDSVYYLNFETSTVNMYNDFDAVDKREIYLGTEINIEDCFIRDYAYSYVEEKSYKRIAKLHVTYSGCSECMFCGEIDPDVEDESCLICEQCQDICRCDECGETCRDLIEIDGHMLCSYCYDNRTLPCDACEEMHFDANMTGIYIIPKLSQIDFKEYKVIAGDSYGRMYDDSFKYEPGQKHFFYYRNREYDVNLCDCRECLEEWKKKYLNPGAKIHTFTTDWEKRYHVFWDDLNFDGKNKFNPVCGDCAPNDTNDEIKRGLEQYGALRKFCLEDPSIFDF